MTLLFKRAIKYAQQDRLENWHRIQELAGLRIERPLTARANLLE
jgi:hypothetical protein